MTKSIVVGAIFFAALLKGLLVSDAAAPEAAIGNINWEEGFIKATGQGTAQPSGNKGLDQIAATRAATVNAQRVLLETIKGVRIDSTTRVENMMVKQDLITAQVSGIVQGAKVVKTSIEWVGEAPVVTVEMQICINLDRCNGRPLVAVLRLEGRADPPYAPQRDFPSPPSQPSTPASIQPSPAATPSAGESKPVAPVKREDRPKIQPADPNKPVTGLILDLEGLPFEREILPIVATKGADNQYLTVYSAKFVQPKIIRTTGVVRYQNSVEMAKKHPCVGDNVLVVPVESITKENMLIIPLEGAKIISESTRYGNNYLGEAKVVVADK
jgi:hypothetical protein